MHTSLNMPKRAMRLLLHEDLVGCGGYTNHTENKKYRLKIFVRSQEALTA